jgi:hypothetical protein
MIVDDDDQHTNFYEAGHCLWNGRPYLDLTSGGRQLVIGASGTEDVAERGGRNRGQESCNKQDLKAGRTGGEREREGGDCEETREAT